MSTITAPAYPPAPFGIGKGVVGANGFSNAIFGQVLPNSGGFTNGATSPWSIQTPTTLFDVSSLTQNHEVVFIAWLRNTQQITSEVDISVTWYRNRDNKVIFAIPNSYFSYQNHIQDPNDAAGQPRGSGYYYDVNTLAYGAWIGWLADDLDRTDPQVLTYPTYPEIQENGDYHVVLSASGGVNFSQTINFAVTGMPAKTVLFNTSSGFSYTLRLSNYFDSSNYIRGGVCTSDFTDGQSFAPSGILDSINAPSNANGGCAVVGSVSLTSNTTIYGWVQAANGSYYKVGLPQFHGNLNPTATHSGYHEARVDWTTNAAATTYQVNVDDGSEWGITYGVGDSSYAYINLDRERHTYPLRVEAWNGTTFISSETITYTTPDETDPSVSIVSSSSTANSITLTVSGYDNAPPNGDSASGIAGYYYYIDLGYGLEYNGTDVNSGSTSSYTFYGLEDGVIYTVGVRSYDGDLNVSTMDTSNVETVIVVPIFEWDTPKSPNQPFNITTSEWNRLTDTITAARAHQNKTEISFTTAPYGDGRFYAFMMNQALVGIRGGTLTPGGFNYEPLDGIDLTNYPLPDNVSSGQTIFASYFNNLRGALNSAD
jgi:hypothetical protein